jgi:hypothetical protein
MSSTASQRRRERHALSAKQHRLHKREGTNRRHRTEKVCSLWLYVYGEKFLAERIQWRESQSLSAALHATSLIRRNPNVEAVLSIGQQLRQNAATLPPISTKIECAHTTVLQLFDSKAARSRNLTSNESNEVAGVSASLRIHIPFQRWTFLL